MLGLLVGLGGLIGSRLGQLWLVFDVFSQFTLQFALMAVAFLIGLLMPRAKLLIAFVILVLGLVGIGTWPHYVSERPQRLAEPAAGEREIRVASFNTWYDNQDAAAVEVEIARLDADIIALIEFGPNKRAILRALAGRYPYKAECFAIDYCHMVVLSKFPIAHSDARAIWEGPPMIEARFGSELGGLTVIGVHTIRFPHSRAQFRQVAALVRKIETIPGHTIVMGDFNATPYSRITGAVSEQTGLVRLTGLPSWPSRLELPQVAIDHIFASPELHQTESEQIGNAAGSDHYPVTVKLAVPSAPASP